MTLFLWLVACVLLAQGPAGDDTNKHSAPMTDETDVLDMAP